MTDRDIPFVELDRDFAGVSDEDDTHEVPYWFRGFTRAQLGLRGWRDLLAHRLVVVLAEAAGGKTEEFRNRARLLAQAGEAAFLAPLEVLAAGGLRMAIEHPDDETRLDAWLSDGTRPDGWFFLDSLDEARLAAGNVELALKALARELGPALERARVLVSCRGSDWYGKRDREMLARALPGLGVPRAPAQVDPDVALLALPEERPAGRETDAPADPADAVQVFRLAPLSPTQRTTLARAAGVADTTAFEEAIVRNGLFSARHSNLSKHVAGLALKALSRFGVLHPALVIELKHGGMEKWSRANLEERLLNQLVGQYLHPTHRRHGILVVTHHGAERTWKAPDGGSLGFPELMAHLDRYAQAIASNPSGRAVLVRAVGLDASPPLRTDRSRKRGVKA